MLPFTRSRHVTVTALLEAGSTERARLTPTTVLHGGVQGGCIAEVEKRLFKYPCLKQSFRLTHLNNSCPQNQLCINDSIVLHKEKRVFVAEENYRANEISRHGSAPTVAPVNP